ncbi:MAG: zinc ribbon domain-containing protein [Spirochaetales bacterium]|nr:zinc ribbon domain-containing protein [Spirochaetales bacterium]
MEIKEDIRALSKKIGKKNLIMGFVLFLLGTAITAATFITAYKTGGTLYLLYGAIGFGFIQIIRGFRQWRLNDYSLIYALNKKHYGAEEPEKTWKCPKCGNVNPNTTFFCQHCSYELQ